MYKLLNKNKLNVTLFNSKYYYLFSGFLKLKLRAFFQVSLGNPNKFVVVPLFKTCFLNDRSFILKN